MESMSIDPAAAAIGSRFVDVATRGTGAGTAALPSLTGLAPAGGEEVSMLAAAAFATEAQAMLALTEAAQQELARAGAAVTDIVRMYAQVDGDAASTLVDGGRELSSPAFSGGSGVSAATKTLHNAGAPATRAPLMAKLIEGMTASNPVTAMPAGANAAATALSAGTAPLSSIGSGGKGAAAGGMTGRGLASALDQEPHQDDNTDSDEPVAPDCLTSTQDDLTRA